MPATLDLARAHRTRLHVDPLAVCAWLGAKRASDGDPVVNRLNTTEIPVAGCCGQGPVEVARGIEQQLSPIKVGVRDFDRSVSH
jgi:hypothetical protein